MCETKYADIFGECYKSLISNKSLKQQSENNDSILPGGFSNTELYNILSKHYETTNIGDTQIKYSPSSHKIQNELEKNIKRTGVIKIGKNTLAITLHRFYEDMAKNLVANFKGFNIDSKNKILFIDDNLDEIITEKIKKVYQIISYKLNENKRNKRNKRNKKNKKNNNTFDDIVDIKNTIKEVREFQEDIEEKLKNNPNDKCELSKYRYIFLDLLIGEELLGFKILKLLKELQDHDSKTYKYEIIIFSRSTNTLDIQKAINLGASTYIPKERVFSIPHRLAKLGPEETIRTSYGSTFRNFTKLPSSFKKELFYTYIEDNSPHREWIKKLPKADIHVHLGGFMDAELTIKLSIKIVNEFINNYCDHKNFGLTELTSKGKKSEFKIKFSEDQKFLEFCKEIFKQAINFREYGMLLEEDSKNRKKEDSFRKVLAPNDFIDYIHNKYQKEFYGLKKHFISSLFNLAICLNVEIDNLDNKLIFKYICQKNNKCVNIEIKNLERLIQATHGNKLEDSVSGITLDTFLKGCQYTGSDVMQTKETIKEAIEDICKKCKEQNIYYLSLRMTPLNFTKGDLTGDEVWEAIINGYEKFTSENKEENYFLVLTIIVALKRHYKDSRLLKNVDFGIKHNYEKEKERMRSHSGQNEGGGFFTKRFPFVCGFDLTGQELYHKPEKFREKFKKIFDNCMPITIHAGEETSAKYIWEAAYELQANRIGHGLSLPDNPYLMSHFKDFNKCVELCPTSNYLTQGNFHLYNNDSNGVGEKKKSDLKDYPSSEFLQKDLDFVVSTDDPAIQNTTITNEFIWLSKLTKRSNKNGITKWEVLKLIRNSFKYSFLPSEIKKKLLTNIDNKIFNILQMEE